MSGVLLITAKPTTSSSWAVDPDLDFVRWLRVFVKIACGHRAKVHMNGVSFPRSVAERRQVHRLALTYARLQPGAYWPLGGGLAPAPARGLTDSVDSPIAPGIGLGSWRPRAVLVGDTPSQGAAWADRHGWSFISGLKSGCSQWLAEQLEAGGVPEEWLFWVNGWRWADRGKGAVLNTEALQYAIFQLNPEIVIALGKKAKESVEAIGFQKALEVHHPQHWKRFHSKDKYVLPKLIRRKVG